MGLAAGVGKLRSPHGAGTSLLIGRGPDFLEWSLVVGKVTQAAEESTAFKLRVGALEGDYLAGRKE